MQRINRAWLAVIVCLVSFLTFIPDLQARRLDFVYTLPSSALINPGAVYSMAFYVITPTEGGLGERRRDKLQGPNTRHTLTFNDAVESHFIPSTVHAYIITPPGYLGIGFDAFLGEVGTIRLFIDGVETPHPISMEIIPTIVGIPNSAAIGITFD